MVAGPQGEPYTASKLRDDIRRAVTSCNEIGEEKKPKITCHVLRHTAASLMVAAGVPIFDVSKILGHSTVTVTMRYAHFAPEAGRATVAALGKILDLGQEPDEGRCSRPWRWPCRVTGSYCWER